MVNELDCGITIDLVNHLREVGDLRIPLRVSPMTANVKAESSLSFAAADWADAVVVKTPTATTDTMAVPRAAHANASCLPPTSMLSRRCSPQRSAYDHSGGHEMQDANCAS